jgi:hypothetical protein
VLLCKGPSRELQKHYSGERNDRLKIYGRGR